MLTSSPTVNGPSVPPEGGAPVREAVEGVAGGRLDQVVLLLHPAAAVDVADVGRLRDVALRPGIRRAAAHATGAETAQRRVIRVGARDGLGGGRPRDSRGEGNGQNEALGGG